MPLRGAIRRSSAMAPTQPRHCGTPGFCSDDSRNHGCSCCRRRCEIPITHHQHASAVALIAGQERHAKASRLPGLRQLGDVPRHAGFLHGGDDRRPVERGTDRVRQAARDARGHHSTLHLGRAAGDPLHLGDRGGNRSCAKASSAGTVHRRQGGRSCSSALLVCRTATGASSGTKLYLVQMPASLPKIPSPPRLDMVANLQPAT